MPDGEPQTLLDTDSEDGSEAEIDRRLGRHLGAMAVIGATITYAQLAAALGLVPPLTIHRATLALERSMRADAAAGRPFLAAVVVGKGRDALPGPGFFVLAAELGRYDGPPSGPEAAAFHERERAAATAMARRGVRSAS